MKSRETLKHFPVNRMMHQTDMMVHHMGEHSTMPQYRHDKMRQDKMLESFHKMPRKNGIPAVHLSETQSVLMSLKRHWTI